MEDYFCTVCKCFISLDPEKERKKEENRLFGKTEGKKKDQHWKKYASRTVYKSDAPFSLYCMSCVERKREDSFPSSLFLIFTFFGECMGESD